MNIIFADFETFWCTKSKYSLTNMTTQSYICDPRFKDHGASVAINNGPIKWVPYRHLQQVFDRLDWANSALCGHNLMFDGSILAWKYGKVPKLYLDTLGLCRALVGAHSARHGLQYMGELLLGEGKGDGLSATNGYRELPAYIEEKLIPYADKDVFLTRGVLRKLLPHFPKNELKVLDRTIRRFTQPTLHLDGELLNEYLETLARRKEQVLVEAGLQDRTVLMSNPKFAEALEQFGVIPPTKISPKTGKVAFAFAKTDEGLKDLLEHPNPDVQALVAARLEVKSTIEQTRAQRFLEASDRGAFPIPVQYAGANVTQRDSGADKLNMKNLTRGGVLRDSIYAPDGCILVVSDLAQIELRITLELGRHMPKSTGKEAESLELMRNGGDLYSWFGSLMYGYTISKATHPLERQMAKSAVLGLGFGMGVDRFIEYCAQQGLRIDREFAQKVVSLYRKTYTGVVQYWYACNGMLQALANNYEYVLPSYGLPVFTAGRDPVFNAPAVKRPNGLYIKYPGLECDENKDWSYKQGNAQSKLFGGKVMENHVQSLARDIQTQMLVEIEEKYVVPMDIYDEAVVICREEEVDACKQYVTEVMTKAPWYMPDLPLGIEIHTGYRYGDCK